MSKEKMIDKIRKCLELSKSDNIHEAESAMLMARKLMATYNINMFEVEEKNTQEINRQVYTGKSAKFIWVRMLAKVIAENNRCKCIISLFGAGRHQKKYTTFVGFKIDIEVCNLLFDYALSCIEYNVRNLDKLGKDSYRFGFINGLVERYKEQEIQEVKKDENFALVCQVPVEVTNYLEINNFKTVNLGGISSFNTNCEAYAKGYADGKTHTTALDVKSEKVI